MYLRHVRQRAQLRLVAGWLQLRPGDNLFANTLVALDLKTGEYKWHYQSIRHDVWDMDNVHPPMLADVTVDGQPRKVVFYGSKSGHIFMLDRTNGKPVTGGRREAAADGLAPDAARRRSRSRVLGDVAARSASSGRSSAPNNIPGNPWRARAELQRLPARRERQPRLHRAELSRRRQAVRDIPAGVRRPTHRKGCMYDTHWDLPVLSTTSQNGGVDWSNHAYSPRTNLLYIPYGINPVAHWRGAGGNGQRALGQYQTGGIFAFDASTDQVKWNEPPGPRHGARPGSAHTASDLLFIGQFDGNFLALDARTATSCGASRPAPPSAAAPVTYTINGEQYVAFFAGGTGIPYGNSVTEGDMLWAFKLGGSYKTASGSRRCRRRRR